MRDISKSWLPVTMVASIVLFVGTIIWWAATEHAAVREIKRAADSAESRAVTAEEKALAAENRAIAAEFAAVAKANEVLAKLAGIEAVVLSVRAQNAGIEMQLAELRAAWVRSSR